MHPVCDASEIPSNDARSFICEGINLIVVNYRNTIHVYHNSCPHRSIPLEWQPNQFFDVEKTFLQCATHGALFKIDTGECIAGPCVGDQLTQIPHSLDANTISVDLSSLPPISTAD